MSLNVFFQQHLLVKGACTHCASILELLMHNHVLIEMGHLQEFLFAYRALIRKTQSVRFHVLVQMRLLLKRFVRTLGAIETGEAAVQQQVLIQRRYLGETTRTLIAHVLLDFMMRFHMVIQIGHLCVCVCVAENV